MAWPLTVCSMLAPARGVGKVRGSGRFPTLSQWDVRAVAFTGEVPGAREASPERKKTLVFPSLRVVHSTLRLRI